jgi:hypothetical protein
MRNREYIENKLDNVENALINCHRWVNTSAPVEDYKQAISKTIDLVNEVRNAIDNEPKDASEIGGK